jgi:uncharacterized membrane protein
MLAVDIGAADLFMVIMLFKLLMVVVMVMMVMMMSWLFTNCVHLVFFQDIHFVALDAGDIALAENAKNKALEIDSELLSTGMNVSI